MPRIVYFLKYRNRKKDHVSFELRNKMYNLEIDFIFEELRVSIYNDRTLISSFNISHKTDNYNIFKINNMDCKILVKPIFGGIEYDIFFD